MEDREYSFERLEVYKIARVWVKSVYILLRKFPSEEKYALCDQIRRASISVTSNIAEGMSRMSTKEQVHFLEISYGSLMEVLSQMQLSVDLAYITDEEYKGIRTQIRSISYLLSKLHKSLENKN